MHRSMYSEDSFYTLSTYGRLAVVVVSLLMFTTLFALSYVLMSARKGVVRVAIGMLLFWVFVWLSPQGYYVLYQFLFEDLPRQWVVGSPPMLDELVGLITFSDRQTLSSHGKGALFWALVLLSWCLRLKAPKAPAPDL
jgi:hypothetical protein